MIAGGGWAGLAAAVELTHNNCSVTLLESAKQLGGRARSVPFMETQVDNGQHIMLGACQHMLGLLDVLKLEEQHILKRSVLDLASISLSDRKKTRLYAPILPAPVHLLIALLTARGFTLREKINAIVFWRNIEKVDFKLDQDIDLLSFLRDQKQSENIIKKLWGPLCTAALNTLPENASANIFIHILKLSFTGKRKYSDLLIPNTDLGNTIPASAHQYIEKHSGNVLLSQSAKELIIENGICNGILTNTDQYSADHVILALPHWITHNILKPIHECNDILQCLEQFSDEPICTIYLQYPEHVRLPKEMMGIHDGYSQWMFDRRICGQNALITIVISAGGEHMNMDNSELTRNITNELSSLYPEWPQPIQSLVIREKRSTFSCVPGINDIRPGNKTPVPGLWLAGDYTNTGLPSTLEGAIQSGVQCAQNILTAHEN